MKLDGLSGSQSVGKKSRRRKQVNLKCSGSGGVDLKESASEVEVNANTWTRRRFEGYVHSIDVYAFYTVPPVYSNLD